MSAFLHNFIADMPGPTFLILYALVIGAALMASWAARRYLDPTNSLPFLAVPARPDPYEIAYLRGEENEVARIAIVGLLQRGYLRVVTDGENEKIAWAKDRPALEGLTDLERRVFQIFSAPLTAQEIFSKNLPLEATACCAKYAERLAVEQLLSSGAWKLKLAVPGAVIITALGGYKLLVALEKGHSNVWFLIIMGAVGLVWLFVMGFRRLSGRGKKYLQGLELAFGQLKTQALAAAPAVGGSGLTSLHLDDNPEAASLRSDPSLTLVAAIFGLDILANTQFDHYQKMFKEGSSGSGSCGGGCGGDGCGGCGGCD